jgi:hypothetical protein
MTIPESYGTFSHLCAPVAQESAHSIPSTRGRRRGVAAAQSPNAPSTWSHELRPARRSAVAGTDSNAPLFTLPAWTETMT